MDSTLIIVLGIILVALIILNNIKVVPTSTSTPIGGCAGTQYGCCLDGITTKMNVYGTNCQPSPYPPPPYPPPPPPPPPYPPPPPPQPIGGCAGTRYGCCPDNVTPKLDQYGSNCIKPIGGCAGTRYGCCPDNVTPKLDQYGSNCIKPIGGCAGTRYGCCPDNVTPKMNQQGTNCPNYPK